MGTDLQHAELLSGDDIQRSCRPLLGTYYAQSSLPSAYTLITAFNLGRGGAVQFLLMGGGTILRASCCLAGFWMGLWGHWTLQGMNAW